MPDHPVNPTLGAVTLALEAVELRLAQARACVDQALADAARGSLTSAIGAVVPVAASFAEAHVLIDSVLLLHRHAHREADAVTKQFSD